MERRLGRAILAARRAVRLTQQELGERVGVHANTIRRWEWEDATPTRANGEALIAAISGVNSVESRKLAQVFGEQELEVASAEARVASTDESSSASAENDALRAVDATFVKMADDFDTAPRRVRRGVLELLERTRAANLSIEALQERLERQMTSGWSD